MGAGYIEFTSPSEDMMKATVHVEHPYKEDVLMIGFVAKYRWVKQLERLVPNDCSPKDAPSKEKIEVQTECLDGVKISSEIIKVIVSGQTRDTDRDGVDDIAECMKTKVVEQIQTEKQKCFVTALTEGLHGIDQAIKLKVLELRNQGWTCTDQGECHKEHAPQSIGQTPTVVQREELVSAVSTGN